MADIIVFQKVQYLFPEGPLLPDLAVNATTTATVNGTVNAIVNATLTTTAK
jgi:hypothetical protein